MDVNPFQPPASPQTTASRRRRRSWSVAGVWISSGIALSLVACLFAALLPVGWMLEAETGVYRPDSNPAKAAYWYSLLRMACIFIYPIAAMAGVLFLTTSGVLASRCITRLFKRLQS
jgi:hypothetical protein